MSDDKAVDQDMIAQEDGSDDSDDSDSEEVELDEATMQQIMSLEAQLVQNPNQYDVHVQVCCCALAACRKGGNRHDVLFAMLYAILTRIWIKAWCPFQGT